MAATKIQTIASTTTVINGSTITFPSNVVVGRTITVIAVSMYAVCLPTLTDNLGNTYTRVVNGAASGGGQYLSVFTAPVTVGGACTITVAMTCSNIPVMFASEMTGLAASPFESYNIFHNTTSPIYAGSVTPTVNGSYLMAVFLDNVIGGTITQGSAWTDQGAFSGGRRCQDLIQTTAAAINADATSATPGNINGYVVVFKAATSATGKRRQSVLRRPPILLNTFVSASKSNVLSRAAVPYVPVNVVQGVTSKSSFFHRRRIR